MTLELIGVVGIALVLLVNQGAWVKRIRAAWPALFACAQCIGFQAGLWAAMGWEYRYVDWLPPQGEWLSPRVMQSLFYGGAVSFFVFTAHKLNGALSAWMLKKAEHKDEPPMFFRLPAIARMRPGDTILKMSDLDEMPPKMKLALTSLRFVGDDQSLDDVEVREVSVRAGDKRYVLYQGTSVPLSVLADTWEKDQLLTEPTECGGAFSVEFKTTRGDWDGMALMGIQAERPHG